MELKLSKKITKPDFQGEFTASILAAAASPEIISFAGGLPNPVSFPVEEMDAAVHKVMQEKGAVALQYSNTQGYQPLRAWIAKRYEVLGVTDVEADSDGEVWHTVDRQIAPGRPIKTPADISDAPAESAATKPFIFLPPKK